MDNNLNNQKLSVVIITLNEIENIERCINSVKWADDIVVIDSGSTDGTQEMAEKCGARVFFNQWEGYGAQKLFGLNQAKYNWCLILDADEVVSDTLKASILDALKSTKYTAYLVQFETYFMSYRVRFGDWGVKHAIRLFCKNNHSYNDSLVHEGVELSKREAPLLNGSIKHYTRHSIHQSISKLNEYSSLSAQNKSKKFNLILAILSGKWAFVRSYLIRLGFLDGRIGYIVAREIEWGAYLKKLKMMIKK